MPVWTEGVSVILPVENAADKLPRFFKNLGRCEALEVMVCDHRSTDASCAVARDHGAHVFRATENLAPAINNAVRNARGTAIWFLTPNCLPPVLSAAYILDVLTTPEFAGGYFRLGRSQGGVKHCLRAWLANRRAGFTGAILPEHGPFLSHEAFDKAGGYPEEKRPITRMMLSARKGGELFVMPDPMWVRL